VPRVDLILYQEDDGTVPILEWLDGLVPRTRDKCLVRLEHLEEYGHELRRPEADYLRNDIYELRAKHLGVNYRMLYFFHGTKVVVVSHGFSKQASKVPKQEIDIAVRRMIEFRAAPTEHSFRPEK
jgi:phage-related protein